MKLGWSLVTCAALVVGIGCSSPGKDSRTIDGVPAYVGHSFTFTASVTPTPSSAPAVGPSSHTFTVVFDADEKTAIIGDVGSARAVTYTRTSTGVLTFDYVQFSNGDLVSGWSIAYAPMTLTQTADGTLTGTARGTVSVSIPGRDLGDGGAVAATLAGVPDTVRPALTVWRYGADDDPFSSIVVHASEPLPPDARPTLIADGMATPLAPPDGADDRFAYAFYGPSTLLRYGQDYQIHVDGITDFVGLPATGGATFTTRAAPPLVAEDGFESVSDATLGGAEVLTSPGAPTITGARSLFIPPLAPDATVALLPATTLALRLAVTPGDTAIRFAYRLVNALPDAALCCIHLASEGGKISLASLAGSATATEAATIPGQGDVRLGPVMTADIPLPADVGSEIVFAPFRPGANNEPTPPGAPGVIIDDLRVE